MSESNKVIKGVENSNIGLALGLYRDKIENKSNLAQDLLGGTIEAMLDSPFYAAGAVMGSSAGPVGAPLGAVGLNSFIKNAYKEAAKGEERNFGQVLRNTANDTAAAAALGIAGKAAPIVYRATLKPIVNEVGRQAKDKASVFVNRLLKELTKKGYPLNADIFRQKNEFIDAVDLNSVNVLKEKINETLKRTRNNLTVSSNRRPYIYNAQKNTYADVPAAFEGKSEHLARNNPDYIELSKKAVQKLPDLYNKAFSVKSYPSFKKSDHTKYIDRKLAAVRYGDDIYPVKFTQKEHYKRDILADELLRLNKGKDYSLYTMEVNTKPPSTERAITALNGNTTLNGNAGGKISLADLLKKVKADTDTGGYELSKKERGKRLLIDALLRAKKKMSI
jgi:hypothetical protein